MSKPGKIRNFVSRIGSAALAVFSLMSPEAALFFGGGQTSSRPTKPYNQVAAVFACVQARADAVAMMRLTICDANDNIIESGPLAELAYRPSRNVTGRAFWRATEAHLCLDGRVYWHKTLLNGRVVEIHVRSRHEVEPVTGPGGDILYYHYSANGTAAPVRVELEAIHAILEPNYESADPSDATGPCQAVTAAIAQYYKSDVANETSLDNDVQPGGVISYPDGADEIQKKELKEELKAKHTGAANRRRVMVLTGTANWQAMQSTFKDMEFSALKSFSREDICAGYRVPPSVAGYYTDSNYAHATASQLMFWQNLILPRGLWLAEEWEMAVLQGHEKDNSLSLANAKKSKQNLRQLKSHARSQGAYRAKADARRYYAYFDSSNIPAIQAAMLSLANAAMLWIDKGVTLNQIIDAFDLPFEKKWWGDTWWVGFGLVDVEEKKDGSGGLLGQDDPPGATQEDLDAGQEDDEQAKGAPSPEQLRQYILRTAPIRQVYDLWRASWAPLEKQVKGKVSRHFNDLRGVVLSNLEKARPENKAVAPSQRRDIVGQILFDIVEANGQLLVKVGPLMRRAHQLGGQQSMDEAAQAQGKDPNPYNLSDPNALAAMRQREIRLTKTNSTLRNQLRETLEEGLKEQETNAQLAERIREKFGFATKRASTIARTEVGGAVEEARQLGREQAGVPMKSWLWSHREKGREWHFAIEQSTMNKPIGNDDVFVSGKTGLTTKQPRGFGEAIEDVNCGCTTLARFHNDKVSDVIGRIHKHGFLTIDQLSKRFAQPIKEAA